MRPAVYCNRGQVKTALDSAETARNNRRIDRLIGASADVVERLTKRTFYPQLATRTLDWPAEWDYPQPWRLWLGGDELVELVSVSVDGVLMALSDVLLRPDTGPPYDRLELDRGANVAWSSGRTPQRAVSIRGVFAGAPIRETPGPTITAGIDASVVSCTVTATPDIDVGSLIRIGTERLNVTGRRMVSTGQTLQVPVDAQLLSNTVRVTNGALFVEDETILLDGEKMRVDEITGNTLVVKRAWDGSTLAAHNGATIYAARTLTVERGACGTTPIPHTLGDAVSVWNPPDLVNQFSIAYTSVALLQESAGYGRMVGSGDNQREAAGRALGALEQQLVSAYRRTRVGAI